MTNASRKRCPLLSIRRVRRLLVTSYLSGVPVAVIAAWIGHKDSSLTMKLYANSQNEAFKAAGATLDRAVTLA